MAIVDIMRDMIENEGRTQRWVADRMNTACPEIEMNEQKLSALLTGKRKLSSDELLAFCKAMGISPDIFMDAETNEKQ